MFSACGLYQGTTLAKRSRAVSVFKDSASAPATLAPVKIVAGEKEFDS